MRIPLFLAFLACVVCASALLDGSEDVVRIELDQRTVSTGVLKTKQAARLAKLGKSARTLPKYHPKLLDVSFKNDYILGNVTVGGQGPFYVALSTGQTTLWVLGKDAKGSFSPNHKSYNPDDSDNGKNLNKDYSTIDGSVVVKGRWYSDVMQYGKAKVKGQSFGVASDVKENNDLGFPLDGVLGINHLNPAAYTSKGEYPAPIDNLLHPLIKKTFTVFLDAQIAPSKGVSKGNVVLGGFDKEHCDGSSVVHAVDVYAQSSSTDYRYVSAVYSFKYDTFSQSENSLAYLDTGVSTLQLPSDDLSAIYNLILPDYDWDNGMYTVSCDAISKLATINVYIDSDYIGISPKNYVVDLDLGDNNCALALGLVDKDSYSSEGFVLGTPLFREFCVSYDFDASQINFYKHVTKKQN